jgi:hypothetical protein
VYPGATVFAEIVPLEEAEARSVVPVTINAAQVKAISDFLSKDLFHLIISF